jgi:hypothetical protein
VSHDDHGKRPKAGAGHDHGGEHGAAVVDPHAGKRPGDPAPSVTRDEVVSAFRATSREYEAYKAKNGSRLEREWGDLATFMQFQLKGDNLDVASHKLAAFRAKLKD